MQLRIENVRTILTAPEGINLVVVRVETSEPGLYGLGCATFTQQAFTVATVLEKYLAPFLVGKDPRRIEDLWQSMYAATYWRNSPVLNNAISGVDMALWDIAGKLAQAPLYQLFGGKCREGVAVYKHADGENPQEVEDNVRRYREEGYRFIRCQMGGYGGAVHLDAAMRLTPRYVPVHAPRGAQPGAYYDPSRYARSIVPLFEHLRESIGFEVELLHDVHERLAPIDAVRLAKELEPYRLFYLEDPVSPEDVDWLQTMRAQTCTPIAMGELFSHPLEWQRVITNRLTDFIRVHLSHIGGITPARKLAALSEAFGVRTAWHGPGDLSPIGYAANLHLDLHVPNFGVQEWVGFSERLQEVFPGCPQVQDGYAYPNDKPGLGVDIDEEKALQYPPIEGLPEWTFARRPDGSPARP
ncbi:MAG: starvation-sensing protein RspA [Firmicutes bacterium]|nr:starvation-sensing protein RspA [Bacillota bacterium]